MNLCDVGFRLQIERIRRQDISSVDALVDAQYADTNVCLTIDNLPVQRRTAAIGRQPPGMQINRAVQWDRQDRLAQNGRKASDDH